MSYKTDINISIFTIVPHLHFSRCTNLRWSDPKTEDRYMVRAAVEYNIDLGPEYNTKTLRSTAFAVREGSCELKAIYVCLCASEK